MLLQLVERCACQTPDILILALTGRGGSDPERTDPSALADRVAADVAAVARAVPGIPVHCTQDAAPELRALPEALTRALPVGNSFVELVDIEHVARDYLDAVVDACEPEATPTT